MDFIVFQFGFFVLHSLNSHDAQNELIIHLFNERSQTLMTNAVMPEAGHTLNDNHVLANFKKKRGRPQT